MLKSATKTTGQKLTYSFKGSCFNSASLVPSLKKNPMALALITQLAEFDAALIALFRR